MLSIFKAMNVNKVQLRELDPSTIQRIKEGAFLVRFISETEIASRKCEFYSGIAEDDEIKRTFADEAKQLRNASHNFQQYYESMTRE